MDPPVHPLLILLFESQGPHSGLFVITLSGTKQPTINFKVGGQRSIH
jgi:hypothetical protein